MNTCTECGSEDDYNFSLNIGLCNACIGKKIERLEEENRWIPVGERLPEPNENTHPQQSVIVKLATITETDAWYEDCDKHWHERRTGKVIKGTHWRRTPDRKENEQ